MCPRHNATRKVQHLYYILLKPYNLSLIMRKHPSTPNSGAFYKKANHDSKSVKAMKATETLRNPHTLEGTEEI